MKKKNEGVSVHSEKGERNEWMEGMGGVKL